MRISDWSSDVCSSDLLRLGLGRRGTRLVGLGLEQFLGRFAIDKLIVFAADRIGLDQHAALYLRHRADPAARRLDERARDGGGGAVGLEIGSASCRERVCQYV